MTILDSVRKGMPGQYSAPAERRVIDGQSEPKA
jgi:hypothetical protein